MSIVETNLAKARKRARRMSFKKDPSKRGKNTLANFVDRVMAQEAAKSPLLRTTDRKP